MEVEVMVESKGVDMISADSKEARWELARLLLCREAWYLASVVWALRGPFWRCNVPTVGISKDLRIFANPEFVKSLPRTALAAVIEHEVWHALLEHSRRRCGREGMKWNITGDLEIHDGCLRPTSLEELSTVMRRNGGDILTPTLFGLPEGRSAEHYYDSIEVYYVEVHGRGSASGGSAADGIPREYEGPEPGDAPGATPAEQRAIARDVARQIARARGDVPTGAERWAEELIGPPVLDWQTLYRQALHTGMSRRSGAVDFTYARPSRRDAGASRGYISPGLYKPEPHVAAVLDTSGSMGDDDLGVVMREMVGLSRAVGARVLVAACDAEVYTWQHYTPSMELTGGGGTDMRLGIESAAQLKPRPDVIVVLTDGYTPWPDEPVRGCAVIAVLTQSDGVGDVPPWITTIVLPDRETTEEDEKKDDEEDEDDDEDD